MMASGIRLGLTGGIACGKSTAGRAFEALGYQRLDSDAIVGQLYRSDPEVRQALAQRWGANLLTADGVDRSAIAQLVFRDSTELAWLESLLHPRVGARWQAALAASEPATAWVVEVPLLFEKDLQHHFTATICVETTPAAQHRRLAAKGVSLAQAAARIAHQLPLAEKISRADWVLSNHGTPAFLQAQVAHLAHQLHHPAN